MSRESMSETGEIRFAGEIGSVLRAGFRVILDVTAGRLPPHDCSPMQKSRCPCSFPLPAEYQSFT